MNQALKPTKKEIVTEFRTREILAAARRLMQSRGVESVTMEEIAATAGVAKGTVYLYFQGKEDLIQALMSQVGKNLIQDLETLLANPGSTQRKTAYPGDRFAEICRGRAVSVPLLCQGRDPGSGLRAPRPREPSTGNGGGVYGAAGAIFCRRNPGQGVHSRRPAAAQLIYSGAGAGGGLLPDDGQRTGWGMPCR